MNVMSEKVISRKYINGSWYEVVETDEPTNPYYQQRNTRSCQSDIDDYYAQKEHYELMKDK